MKLLIEEYPYPVDQIRDLFPDVNELDPVDGKAKVGYVGYYYHAAKGESVFILPKVVLDKDGKVFNEFSPEEIIDLQSENNPLRAKNMKKERDFLYGLSVWIYRAIAVYLEDARRGNRDHTIIRHQKVMKQGNGRRETANTYLDILLSLVDFAKQNRDWVTFIVRNAHSGLNKINWVKTISKSNAILQDDEVVYLNPINKKKLVNFDEELLVIFYSILHHIHEAYGFTVETNVNYNLIPKKKFQKYLEGQGVKRLRKIKYKYFSDKALQLWNLCYAFFEQSENIRVHASMNEFLLAKNFNIVFEAIIDELIGEKTLPKRLNKKQEDGKTVDHLFLWDSLTHVRKPEEKKQEVYYIGDSKYYQQRNEIGREAVAKQFTYARNVIQWNLNLFFGEDGDVSEEGDFCLRDELTEGYNIIPNFFISGTVPQSLDYEDNIDVTSRRATTYVSQQFNNRLFDRDTLLVTHYDVNFLFVLALYARNNPHRKREWREKVRNIFRDKIRDELAKRYSFHAMRARPEINTAEWLETHFKDVLGKVFAPYETDKGVIALALNKDPKCQEENERILSLVDAAFIRVPLNGLHEDPRALLPAPAVSVKPVLPKPGVLMVMMMNYEQKLPKFSETGKIAVPIPYTKDGMEILGNAGNIGVVLFHARSVNKQHLFKIAKPVQFVPKPELPVDEYYMIRDKAAQPYPEEIIYVYALVEIDMSEELDSSSLDCRKKPFVDKTERYEAQYVILDEIKI